MGCCGCRRGGCGAQRWPPGVTTSVVPRGASVGEPGGEGLRGLVHALPGPAQPGQRRLGDHRLLRQRLVQRAVERRRRPRPARQHRPGPDAGPGAPRPHPGPRPVTRPREQGFPSLPGDFRAPVPSSTPQPRRGFRGSGRVLPAAQRARPPPSSRKAGTESLLTPSDVVFVLPRFRFYFSTQNSA